MLAQYVVQQARRGLQLAQRTRHATGQARNQQPGDASDASELASRQLAQVHRRTQIVEQLISSEQRPPLLRLQIDRLRRGQHQAVVVHCIADAVALPAREPQRQQRGQCLVNVAAGKRIDEQELAVAPPHVFNQQMVRPGACGHLFLQSQQRSQPA